VEKSMQRCSFAALAVLLIVCFTTSRGLACIAIGSLPVRVANETAVIVWNSSTHVEHFIRQASFDTQSPNFGFVVPTPTVPKLEAADERALPLLTDLMQPTLRGEVTQIVPVSWWAMMLGHTALHKLSYVGSLAVDVVAEQHVAGMDATTLSASDESSLDSGMKANGYPWGADQDNWLEPYIRQHWVITLFKFSKSAPDQSTISSNLLNMSFTTWHARRGQGARGPSPSLTRLRRPRHLSRFT